MRSLIEVGEEGNFSTVPLRADRNWRYLEYAPEPTGRSVNENHSESMDRCRRSLHSCTAGMRICTVSSATNPILQDLLDLFFLFAPCFRVGDGGAEGEVILLQLLKNSTTTEVAWIASHASVKPRSGGCFELVELRLCSRLRA